MSEPTYKTIPQLDSASTVADSTLFEAAVVDGGDPSGYASKKVSGSQLKTYIGSGGSSVSPYTSNPAALGTASPGSSANYSRGDHVHPKPSASDIGAIALPSSPSSGQFLVYNGSAWVAQTVPSAHGEEF